MSIPLNIFHRDDLPLGGFSGLKEHRLVVDRKVGMLNAGQEILKSEEFMAYVTRGDGTLNGVDVREGDLVRGKDITFTASDEVQIILFTTED